jgi:hypothetical protein
VANTGCAMMMIPSNPKTSTDTHTAHTLLASYVGWGTASLPHPCQNRQDSFEPCIDFISPIGTTVFLKP